MIAHGAEHARLEVAEGHVIRKTADVQFGIAMTVRIAANDKHMFSAVAPHIGQRYRACRGAKGSGSSRASPIKARLRRTDNPVVLRYRSRGYALIAHAAEAAMSLDLPERATPGPDRRSTGTAGIHHARGVRTLTRKSVTLSRKLFRTQL
jgi:hypothetical protein